ncbi:MAG: hypothetical protein ACRETG_01680 [Steroidobacteraceae bacterium]
MLDEPQIEDVFGRGGSSSPGSHDKVVVVDDAELEDTTPQRASQSNTRVNLPGSVRLGDFPVVGLEQDMFSLGHATFHEPLGT